MKKLAIIPVFLILFSFGAKAQDGYKYFDVAAGYMFPGHYAAEISIEISKKYHNAYSYYLEAYSNEDYYKEGSFKHNTGEFGVMAGMAYKPILVRNKNVALNARFTGAAGTTGDKFIAGLSAGVELNFALRSGNFFFIRQKNQVVFWADENWRIGLLAGFKIPLN